MRRGHGLTTPQLTLIRRYTHPEHFPTRERIERLANDWIQVAPGKWWPREELSTGGTEAS